jgi:xanthine dehydrogenase accessory factor
MKHYTTWKFIAGCLRQNISVMLLYVLESKGSSPGRQGFFMAVSATGEMEGSIGGGMMEHKLVELAREKLRNTEQGTRNAEQGSIKKQVHDKSSAVNQSGMICSGEQTIWLYPVSKEEAIVIQQIIDSLEQYKSGTLVFSPAGISFEAVLPEQNFSFRFQSEVDWCYKEKTGYKNKLFIIGGGHCALALSRLMCSMDFYICLYDDRVELKTMQENEAAHEKHVVADYSELTRLIAPGDDHYVVIMTFGYRTDDIAVRALLEKQFRYLGVLGSRKKMEKLLTDYRTAGIKEEWLQRIHTPIGLAINSQTPEEIAVSIAAQIISIKNKQL